jgi:hypothetical protein
MALMSVSHSCRANSRPELLDDLWEIAVRRRRRWRTRREEVAMAEGHWREHGNVRKVAHGRSDGWREAAEGRARGRNEVERRGSRVGAVVLAHGGADGRGGEKEGHGLDGRD